jgi:hypothetical protein
VRVLHVILIIGVKQVNFSEKSALLLCLDRGVWCACSRVQVRGLTSEMLV